MEYQNEIKCLTLGNVKFNEPLFSHTTAGVGGKAKYFIQVTGLKMLNEIIEFFKRKKIKYYILGAGSNLLVSDNGFDGAIISLKNVNSITLDGQTSIKVMAGAKGQKLVDFCVAHNLTGLEFLTMIPASVGGMVCMNCGAFNGCIADKVVYVETLEKGKIKRYSKADCGFEYRSSRFLRQKKIITGVKFSLDKVDAETINLNLKNYRERRQASFPKGKSFGSVFLNPKGYSCGQIIDSLNLKGTRVGGARVSNEHANFIVNDNNATAQDIYELILKIKEEVYKKTSITLREEVIYLGKFK